MQTSGDVSDYSFTRKRLAPAVVVIVVEVYGRRTTSGRDLRSS